MKSLKLTLTLAFCLAASLNASAQSLTANSLTLTDLTNGYVATLSVDGLLSSNIALSLPAASGALLSTGSLPSQTWVLAGNTLTGGGAPTPQTNTSALITHLTCYGRPTVQNGSVSHQLVT